ncbi:MAG: hypothetical protein JWM34_1434 [Ilumatobacteraceae bacterium]|nr:hypothetical protein [Ilumatobacteraceae bacterium]
MLTRHGWGAIVLAFVTAIIGRFFGVLELFVLGAGIFTLVVATLVWVRARRIQLEVQRHVVPSTLQVGEVGRVELRITNRNRTSTSPLHLWEPVSGMGGATLRLAPMRGGETISANYRLPATRRGTLVFGPLLAERRDPFGLCTMRHEVAGTHEIVVLPSHLALTLPSGNGSSGPIGRHLRMRTLGRDGSEFHSLRDYADGDDLRRIHWRASARSETLKVREVEPEGLRRCTVALDTSASEYTPESFERAVSAAASAIASASRSALSIRLVVGSAQDLRNTNPLAALHALADCDVTDDERAMPFGAPAGEGLGLFIIVTGSPQSAAVAEARRTTSPNDVLVVIACTSLTSTSAGFVIDCTDESEFAASWLAMTGGRAATTRVAS